MLTARLPTTARTIGDLLAQAGRARATGEVRVVGPSGVPHVVTLRGGNVVRARVAGRFDPLLTRLAVAGEMDDEGFLLLVEALASSDRRSGELAISVGGISAATVRAALVAQARERLVSLLDTRPSRQREAWLVSRAVAPDEAAVMLGWQEVVRGAVRARAARPAPAVARAHTSRDAARRELRRLARELHPDLHAHLPAAQRDVLASRLARATAAFHAIG